jgi:hypothetical protein
MDNNEKYNNELIIQIEKAAEKGAKKGIINGGILLRVLSVAIVPVIVICGILYLKYSIEKKWNNFTKDFKKQFTFANSAVSHDMVLDNDGIFGYTAADFADAVLGDSSQLSKIEVYEAKISDVVTLTDTGLINLGIFTKTQLVTYNGTAIYTVDLAELSEADFVLDEDNKTVTIYIPHSVCGTIDTPPDEMEFGDIDRGWLAFGDINMTIEQSSELEPEARTKMESKLDELNEAETADRFAVLTVWELYQPVISEVSPEYKLEIDFNE